MFTRGYIPVKDISGNVADILSDFGDFYGENLRLEECRMLGITDYFATITDDGKPGRALKIGWFLNEFFWDPGMNNSKGPELPSSHISEVPLSFSSC
jgi:hypothetical protein